MIQSVEYLMHPWCLCRPPVAMILHSAMYFGWSHILDDHKLHHERSRGWLPATGLAVLFRLYQEVWSNAVVVAPWYGSLVSTYQYSRFVKLPRDAHS